ncbi:aftiphilin isoform X1 [Sphaeramia orbicularis]|uniref:aftiphilin isoform X1 n=1 Tax=Sphaeramia orbicularis TaxID=375764 RepID=UPI00117CA829|nr:aftiphilin-like isoform X1 [Sphaeramia orbicularis]
MESDIMPLHSSSPPPLDDDEGTSSEEDEFGNFGGFPVPLPCSAFGSAEATSDLEQPSPTPKPATLLHPNCSFNHQVAQPQPTSTVNSGCSSDQMHIEGQHSNAESSLHLTNGYSEKDCTSGVHKASILGTSSHTEETGFADFSVFTEQPAHPWCCGFSPISSAELWDGRKEVTNLSTRLSEQLTNPGQEMIMDSEPKSYCAYMSKENICTKVKHCEKRTGVKSSQDSSQAQDFPSEESHLGEEELSNPGENQKERKHSSDVQTSEVVEGESEDDRDEKEKSTSTLFQTASMYESATEDMASLSEDLSMDEPSEDFEPNVSSLASQENQTDSEEDDEEELRNYRLSKSFCKNDNWQNLTSSHPEAERGFYHHDQSTSQESSATSIQSESNTEDGLSDFRCGSSEHHMHQDHVQTVDAEMHSLGSLPPSDSFADFCSAPTQEDAEEAWATFQDQTAQVEEECKEQEIHEEEKNWAEQYTGSRRNSCQVSLCRVQQLLQASFPEVVTSAEECEDEVLRLDALLHAQQLLDQQKEEGTGLSSGAQRVPVSTWWPQQDIHSAAGLQFQWGGSHTNRILLRCLGVDTRNIVFIGIKKQPVVVPAFASNLGLLEPTKDSVASVCSPEHTVVTPQAPTGPQDRPNAPSDSMQEGPPSSQLNWSSRGLSSSQDGMSPRRTPHFWGRK